MKRALPPSATEQHCRDEAARWFAHMLDADLAARDRESFVAWYESDPRHAKSYDELRRVWAFSGEVTKNPELLAEARRALHSASRPWFRQPLWATAALLVVSAIAVAYGWWMHVDRQAMNVAQYATSVGELRDVNLKDGSRMLMDTNSAVAVRYQANSRSATVLRGRVQFDIRHDSGSPFTVQARKGTVRDIGTLFQVDVASRGVTVTVLEGQVSVRVDGQRAKHVSAVDRGEQLHYTNDGRVTALQTVDLAAAIGWPHGDLVANNWSLARLVQTMNGYSDVKLSFATDPLRHERISGVFHAGDQEALVRMLESGWSIRAHRASSKLIVLAQATVPTAN